MPAIDFSQTTVFLDFDGTMTVEDSGEFVLRRLARPEWKAIDERYDAGEIGSLECMTREWACLPVEDRALLMATAHQAQLDPGVHDLVDWLKDRGADVVVLSDGFGFYAEEVGRELGLQILTNRVNWETGQLEFPNQRPECECGLCCTCKRAPFREAKARGRTIVFVGDGTSDTLAAPLADVLFAKGQLADWCRREGVAFREYETLCDVLEALRAF